MIFYDEIFFRFFDLSVCLDYYKNVFFKWFMVWLIDIMIVGIVLVIIVFFMVFIVVFFFFVFLLVIGFLYCWFMLIGCLVIWGMWMMVIEFCMNIGE